MADKRQIHDIFSKAAQRHDTELHTMMLQGREPSFLFLPRCTFIVALNILSVSVSLISPYQNIYQNGVEAIYFCAIPDCTDCICDCRLNHNLCCKINCLWKEVNVSIICSQSQTALPGIKETVILNYYCHYITVTNLTF